MRSEGDFQKEVIDDIERCLSGSIVLKNDPTYIQGIPDLLVLYKNKWAALECKKSKNAKRQPNQSYYVNMMNDMSYANFICPENKEEILDELQQTLRA